MVEEVEEEITVENPRSELNLQKFMDDMRMLGEQVKDKSLAKPPFDYGDLGITNYLLWLILGELMQLNDKVEIE
jgi:hypothetical protein